MVQRKSITLNIENMLCFFDEKPKNNIHHATTICSVAGEEMGIALLKHYFSKTIIQ
jgi:hypothetical protein